MVFLFYFFLWYWGLNSGPIPWATLPALLCDEFFLRSGLMELFAQLGFEPQSSWVARITGVSCWRPASTVWF
jgi:hypothetical protein